MNKLINIARKLDIVFKIADVMLKIAFVACLVFLGIAGAGLLFNLPDEMIGKVDSLLEMGPITLHIADGYLPNFDMMLIQAVLMCLMGVGMSFIGIWCMKTIRAILAPMKEGQPFHRQISINLRKLGWLSFVLGLVGQIMKAVCLLTTAAVHDIGALLVSEKITHVDVNASFDLTVLVIPAVLFLMAYVFKYGEELQKLSDETV